MKRLKLKHVRKVKKNIDRGRKVSELVSGKKRESK